MDIEYLPLLGVLRDLYSQPRSMERFKRYVDTMLGGTGDVVLPIGVANPMAKEDAVAKLDELIGLGAEEVGVKAAQEAAARLGGVPGALKVGLVLADDAHGGWTNRYLTEATSRFDDRGGLKRGFATGLLWTGESPTPAQIREELLRAMYRAAYQQRHGLPGTLGAMLAQEGLAAVFAGASPWLPPGELDAAREVMAPHLDAPAATSYPVVFACMYGDEAAESVGYARLGLPPRAGFGVALADALDRRQDPVAALD
ncbi:MAG: hypothetical protein ACRDI2_14195 [Chloroflexota bacterium]